MRGLDTNILLRFLTADDPIQAERVAALFEEAERTGERLFVSIIALCELSWTLRGKPYRLARGQIAAVLERILGTSLLEVQDRGLVRRALAEYRPGRADFADYLLGRQNLEAGCAATVTFDRKLNGAAGFSFLA
ncbi:MAG TPA: type II toxin-antitoxin system VapC family toxin [Thermoanaerobaculia bacterium]|nr:type II toxin-antitoxin system VapC family toxin [Thermoanaerobaculia bacterium]